MVSGLHIYNFFYFDTYVTIIFPKSIPSSAGIVNATGFLLFIICPKVGKGTFEVPSDCKLLAVLI
jgi:hypothetical protein